MRWSHPNTQSGMEFTGSIFGRATLLLAGLLLAPASQAAIDVQVNQDPAGRIQNNPSITLEPVTGNKIVAYIDDPTGATGIGISYWSPLTSQWADATLTPPTGGWDAVQLAPSIVADAPGMVYAAMASYDAWPGLHNRSSILVTRSGDGGQSFGAPFQVAPPQSTNYPLELLPKIEVDEFLPPSPHHGNLYTVWQRDYATGARDIYYAVSQDQGGTWSAPNYINDAAVNNAGQCYWPDPAVGNDGRLAVGWLEMPATLWHQGQIWTDVSTDGGQSFAQDIPAVTFWTVPTTLTGVGGMPSYQAMSYPSVEVDPSNPNRIGIVYAADPDDGTAVEVRLDGGDFPAGSSDASLLSPFSGGTTMACSNGYVYGVWADYRAPGGDIYFKRSQTGIATWTSSEVKLSTQPPLEHTGAHEPVLVATGNNVYVAWDEWNGVDFVHLIYFNRSLDNGSTWFAQAINLDTQMQVAFAADVTLSGDGNNVAAAWVVGQNPSVREIWANGSTDGGTTWSGEVAIRTNQFADSPDLAQVGTNVYCVWAELFGGSASYIYFSRSVNSGASWTAPVRLDITAPPNVGWSYAPQVCAINNNVYVCWTDKRNNNTDNIYFAHSTNYGMSWSQDMIINTNGLGVSRETYPQMTCLGSNVYITYSSDRIGVIGQGPTDIYINQSNDAGQSWLLSDQRVDLGSPPGAAESHYPRVCAYSYGGPDYIYVTWQDDRNAASPGAAYDIYATYSNDGGATWLARDYRVDVGSQPGTHMAEMPHTACDYTGPYYMWLDQRNGLRDVYANQYRTGPDEGDVFYIESLDGGATYGNPIRVNDDPGTNDQTHPWLDIKPNGTVDVVWYDKRNDPMDLVPEVYFAALLPGAATFMANQVISDQPTPPPTTTPNWIGDYIWIDVDQTHAHIVWEDTRTDLGYGDIYYDTVRNPTTSPLGACCFPTTECVTMSVEECMWAGGVFLGEGIPCEPNPCEPQIDWANHDVGNCILTVTDQGILGFMDDTQTEGDGFIYPMGGENRLFVGSFWAGLDPTYVANRDYSADPTAEWIVAEDPDGHPVIDYGGYSTQDIQVGFTDDGPGGSAGIHVTQTSWAWNAGSNMDDFVILNYAVENRGAHPLVDIYLGLFLDIDIGTFTENEGAVDPDLQLAYLYDATGIHVGVKLIDVGLPIANMTLIHNPTYVWPEQYILDPDRHAFLAASDPDHSLPASFELADYGLLVSVGPLTLDPGIIQDVSFAIVGGESLYDLQQHAHITQLIMANGASGVTDPQVLPESRMLMCTPNPFSSQTSVGFTLSGQSDVNVGVFDVNGRLVRNLVRGSLVGGPHTLHWNGRDDAGRTVNAGVYYLRMTSAAARQSRAVILMR